MNHQSTNNGKKDDDKKTRSITNFFAAHVTPKETPTAPKPTKSNKSKSTKSNDDNIAPSICIDKDFNLGDDETATTTVLRKRKKVVANSVEKSGNEGTPPKKVAVVRFF